MAALFKQEGQQGQNLPLCANPMSFIEARQEAPRTVSDVARVEDDPAPRYLEWKRGSRDTMLYAKLVEVAAASQAMNSRKR